MSFSRFDPTPRPLRAPHRAARSRRRGAGRAGPRACRAGRPGRDRLAGAAVSGRRRDRPADPDRRRQGRAQQPPAPDDLFRTRYRPRQGRGREPVAGELRSQARTNAPRPPDRCTTTPRSARSGPILCSTAATTSPPAWRCPMLASRWASRCSAPRSAASRARSARSPDIWPARPATAASSATRSMPRTATRAPTTACSARWPAGSAPSRRSRRCACCWRTSAGSASLSGARSTCSTGWRRHAQVQDRQGPGMPRVRVTRRLAFPRPTPAPARPPGRAGSRRTRPSPGCARG